MKFLHQMFNVLTLLLDDALMPATTLTNYCCNSLLHSVTFHKVV